jgi:hypothetical protein
MFFSLSLKYTARSIKFEPSHPKKAGFILQRGEPDDQKILVIRRLDFVEPSGVEVRFPDHIEKVVCGAGMYWVALPTEIKDHSFIFPGIDAFPA